MSDSFTLYKLIVLYMLQKVDFPLTNSQISEFVLDKEYTNYFTLQQALSEMENANLIRLEKEHNRTFYHLTEEGAETIQFFQNKISPTIQDEIDTFLQEKHYELKNAVAVRADYYRNDNHEFSVRCQVTENHGSLIDLTITVPTEQEAKTVVHHWKQKNQEIYAFVMQNLL